MTADPEARRRTLARLDQCREAAWPAALAGDPGAVRVVSAVTERRGRLLGL